jgi:hypothetical protein
MPFLHSYNANAKVFFLLGHFLKKFASPQLYKVSEKNQDSDLALF